jgi:hypothetical protein
MNCNSEIIRLEKFGKLAQRILEKVFPMLALLKPKSTTESITELTKAFVKNTLATESPLKSATELKTDLAAELRKNLLTRLVTSLGIGSKTVFLAKLNKTDSSTELAKKLTTEFAKKFAKVFATGLTTENAKKLAKSLETDLVTELATEISIKLLKWLGTYLVTEWATEMAKKLAKVCATKFTADRATESTIKLKSKFTTELASELKTELKKNLITLLAAKFTGELAKLTTEFAKEPATESATESTTEPATESTTELATEPATELTTGLATGPATESTTEFETELTTEPATELTTVFATEPATELTTGPATELATEPATESTTEFATELTRGLVTAVKAGLMMEYFQLAIELEIELADTELINEIETELRTESGAEFMNKLATELLIELSTEYATELVQNLLIEPVTKYTTELATRLVEESPTKFSTEFATESATGKRDDVIFEQLTGIIEGVLWEIMIKARINCWYEILVVFLRNKSNNDVTFTFDEEMKQNSNYKINFEELKKIGNGAFGEVFIIRHRKNEFGFNNTSLQVVKKIEIIYSDEMKLCGMFLGFLKLKKIHNERFVLFFDTWLEIDYQLNGLFLFVQMELCDGNLTNIFEDFQNGPIMIGSHKSTLKSYDLANYIFIEVLEAVNYLHNQKPIIIHGNIKPENILYKKVNNKLLIKLGDIGLRALDEFSLRKLISTCEGKYSAPEVLNDRKFDQKSDIFSLGIILQELFDIDLNK